MQMSANHGISIELVLDETGFDALEKEWSDLHSKRLGNGLFNTWYWNNLWWRSYGSRDGLYIVVVRINGTVEGIAPFYRCETSLLKIKTASTLRFIGSGADTSPDDLDVLWNPEHEVQVMNALLCHIYESAGLVRTLFTDMPEESAFAAAVLDHAELSGWSIATVKNQSRMVQSLPASLSSYEGSLSRNARKKRKKRRRVLEETGHYRFHQCCSPDEVKSIFRTLAELHLKRQASKGVQGSFSTTKYNEFHLTLMLQALQRDELRLITLSVDDVVIGVEYAFKFNESLLFFQSGFDPDYQHLSPGHLLMMDLIDRAIREGVRNIDLLRGNYAYKKSYATQQKTTLSVDIWRNPAVAHASRAARSLRSAWHSLLASERGLVGKGDI